MDFIFDTGQAQIDSAAYTRCGAVLHKCCNHGGSTEEEKNGYVVFKTNLHEPAGK